MGNDGEYPDVRPIPEVVTEMLAIADRCETANVNHGEATAMVARGLSLILELRVPRMPDTNEELADLLADAKIDNTFTTDETFDSARQHSKIFQNYLATFRQMISQGRLDDAALTLGLDEVEGSPIWHGELATIEIVTSQDCVTASITRGADKQRCTSPTRALAILGATMRSHARWRDLASR